MERFIGLLSRAIGGGFERGHAIELAKRSKVCLTRQRRFWVSHPPSCVGGRSAVEAFRLASSESDLARQKRLNLKLTRARRDYRS